MPRLKYLKQPLRKLKLPHIGVLCLKCGWLGVSWNRHDYKTCSCQNRAMIDGGFDYLRCGAMKMKDIQLITLTPVKEPK